MRTTTDTAADGSHHLQTTRVLGSVIVAAVLAIAPAADASFDTEKCLAKKASAWGTLRKCQRSQDAKRLNGKTSDPGKCQSVFQQQLTKIDAKASDEAVACRYGDNGNGTVTDYDTGLMWEKKSGTVGGLCLIPSGVDHCVNDTYEWSDAQAFVASASADGVTIVPFLAGQFDWRLPTIVELKGIVDATRPGCGAGTPCIDPIFGATITAANYWSSTTDSAHLNEAWNVNFGVGLVGEGTKNILSPVRAVRNAL